MTCHYQEPFCMGLSLKNFSHVPSGLFQSHIRLYFGLSTVKDREKLDNPILSGRRSWSLVVVAISGRRLETHHFTFIFFALHVFL